MERIRTALIILFLAAPAFATDVLPYRVNQVGVMENDEFLYSQIYRILNSNLFILNRSTQSGFTQAYMSSATISRIKTDAIYELNRSSAMGYWINRTYSASNYTGSGSIAWTVQSTTADVDGEQYMLIGKTMFYHLNLVATTISGTGNTLRVSIPGGFTAAEVATSYCWIKENNAYITPGYIEVSAGGTILQIIKNDESNWAAGVDNNQMRCQINFEVQ